MREPPLDGATNKKSWVALGYKLTTKQCPPQPASVRLFPASVGHRTPKKERRDVTPRYCKTRFVSPPIGSKSKVPSFDLSTRPPAPPLSIKMNTGLILILVEAGK
ncbi:hypothetical protein TNCV_3247531 [Trichonephila clavipes]|nr:hypothetical protein TNCV_3247531 [Trichonephila clavipes]